MRERAAGCDDAGVPARTRLPAQRRSKDRLGRLVEEWAGSAGLPGQAVSRDRLLTSVMIYRDGRLPAQLYHKVAGLLPIS
jgi:hypothetical protein